MSAEPLSEREALRLLPWYVSGQLTECQHAGVTRTLAGSPLLQRELLDAVRLQAAVAAVEIEGHDAQTGWARLARAIGVAAPRARAAKPPKPALLSRLLAQLPVEAPLATAATAMLVLLVGAAVLTHLPQRGQEGYVTLAQPSPADSSAPRFLLSFNPDARISEIDGLLRTQGLTIVSGPDSQALFVASIADPRRVSAPTAVLQALGGHPNLVRFSALAAP